MLHIGFYITGKERMTEVLNNELECERDSTHRPPPGAKFCSECGGMMVASNGTAQQPINIYDIPEEEGDIVDQFIFPEYSPAKEGEIIGISNYCAGKFVDIAPDEIIDLDDMEAIKRQQYVKFMEYHSEDIALLRKYVYDDIEIKYGLFEYDY